MNYHAVSVKQPKSMDREDIQRLETMNPALKRMNDATIHQPRGFSISKAELLKLIDDADERTQAKLIKLWKTCVFWARGIHVEYWARVKGYGFPLAEHEVHVGHDKRLASQERKMRQEALRLAAIRTEDLGERDQHRRVLLVQHTNTIAGSINAKRDLAALWAKTPETMPRLER